MAEEKNAKTNGTRTVALNVRLKPAEHNHLPVVANYSHVHVAQGIAHVNFGFIEPSLLLEMGTRSRKGESLPQNMEGSLATRGRFLSMPSSDCRNSCLKSSRR
jgi:hypothetical protein